MALDLDALKVFVKVAELGSFTRAAEQLRLNKARVSLQVKGLETDLGSQLLSRTTRVVRLTEDGEQLLARAHQLLTEADEVETMFQSSRGLRGRVKVDLPVNLAREVMIPRLPELLSRHPGLELVVSATDRRVDPQREGFDCVLRIGPVGDGSLVGRRLGLMPMMNCASPGYLRKYGVPQRLEDLERHLVVHYASSGAEGTPSFEYPHGGGYREWPMRSVLTVNNVDAYVAGCLAGLGLIQVPKAGRRMTLAVGTLVDVLPELTCAPMPVTLLHTHGRRVPRRVRAVLTWLSEVLAPHIEAIAT